ncbi:MAG: AraC family transcriptional regulator [Christensenellales bacterium]|jgi:hypothetical protein
MQIVRVVELPAGKMVESGCAMFGQGPLERFSQWMSVQPLDLCPQDFLWYDQRRGGFVWHYYYRPGMDVPEDFGLVEFPGGLYAVVTDIDGQSDDPQRQAVADFLAAHPAFARDEARPELGNVITPPAAQSALGYGQMNYYTPIKLAED